MQAVVVSGAIKLELNTPTPYFATLFEKTDNCVTVTCLLKSEDRIQTYKKRLAESLEKSF